MLSVAVAPEKKCWCSPAARADCWARLPEKGVGLLLIQFQESPPSAPEVAPVGIESSTHTILGESALKVAWAKARRPSGHCASASTHCAPLFSGLKVKVGPYAGSWSRASQVSRAPVRSIPG